MRTLRSVREWPAYDAETYLGDWCAEMPAVRGLRVTRARGTWIVGLMELGAARAWGEGATLDRAWRDAARQLLLSRGAQ